MGMGKVMHCKIDYGLLAPMCESLKSLPFVHFKCINYTALKFNANKAV